MDGSKDDNMGDSKDESSDGSRDDSSGGSSSKSFQFGSPETNAQARAMKA